MRELLASAEAYGEARATLASAREAELFRFALYSYRRANNLGLDLALTIDGTAVIARKRQAHRVELVLQPDEDTFAN